MNSDHIYEKHADKNTKCHKTTHMLRTDHIYVLITAYVCGTQHSTEQLCQSSLLSTRQSLMW